MKEKNGILDNSDIMAFCVEKAAERAGFTQTNPLVGAAVVKNGIVISYGVHEIFGGPHAEVNALDSAGGHASGADLFVTLEPCSTFGKTPPCVDRVIASGIKNVYVGAVDPNPLHAGSGINKLREAGLKVSVGVELEKCAKLIENFVKSQFKGKPYVTMKIAMSADGRIGTKTGDSKWITSEESRNIVHKMRGMSGAVLAGIGTALADDPMLNNRLPDALRQPIRVVLDGSARLSVNSKLIKTCRDVPVILYVSERAASENVKKLRDAGGDVELVPLSGGRLDLDFILKSLYSKNIMDVFVEGGASIFGSFCDEDEVDRLELFLAPKIIGGRDALPAIGGSGKAYMKDIKEFYSVTSEMCGKDVLVHANIKDYSETVTKMTEKFMKDC